MNPPHPITLVRRRAQDSGRGKVLLDDVRGLPPLLMPYSRRAARLVERIGLERPGLRLSGLLAELSAAGHKGVPQILVDKLGAALLAWLDGAPPAASAPADPRVAHLLDDVRALQRQTQALDHDARPTPRIARLTLEETPPAFFFSEGRGLESVPSGLALPLDRKPLAFVPVRGPMLDVASRLYAIERVLDVLLEPIADEADRVLAMLATSTLVKVAMLAGGGVRVTLKDRALAPTLGLGDDDEDAPGSYVVHKPARALEVLAALALRDDVTVAWSSAARLKLARAAPRQLKVHLGPRRDWLGLDGVVSIDDDTRAALAAVLDTIRAGRRYLVVDKEKLIALSDELIDALAPLAVAASEPALAIAAQAGAQVEGEWRPARVDVDGEPPPGFLATLRPYQKDGLRFLRRLAAWHTGGVLADDMGLGKTLMALAFLVDRQALGPALVVVPTSVAFQWRAHIEKYAPGLNVDVVSYTTITRRGTKRAYATLILDEAQQVKNATTQRARALKKVDAQLRVALTGTPLENHTGELWAIFDAVAPGLFGTWTEFKARFASPIEKDADERRRRTLARAIAPFVLRRKKRDVAPELPPRTEVEEYVDLTPEERRAYDNTREALLADLVRPKDMPQLPPAQRRARMLAAITRLRLVACHPAFAGDVLLPPAQTEPASKQRRLVERLVALRDAGHCALVFSQFVKHLEIARAAAEAARIRTLQLDGSTPADQREALVGRFDAGEADAFFISLKAGGSGLNLVRASYVVHLDPWWNPAVEDQATDRAHRIGQTLPVTVLRLIARETLEEQILELHAHKRALVDAVLEGTDAAATLSVDELLDLIRK